MKNLYFFLGILVFFFSCKEKEAGEKTYSDKKTAFKETQKILSENAYILNENFPKGDVRRYGIFPDSAYTNIHPVSNKSKITTVLNMAEANKIELFFPKGYYKTALLLDSRKNIKLRFDKAEFDLVQITQISKNHTKPENIELKGELIIYDRLGITEATNIKIDTVYLKSDIEKSIRSMRSRGCQIYHGCKDIKIKYLSIDDFGSGDNRYKNNHASLAVDGWKNNPENLHIQKLYIKSSDRHGIYLTGSNHKIDEIVIDQFGVGSSEGMTPMQDASLVEHQLFSAIWINRCYNSTIGDITINSKNSDGYFTTNFDEGDSLNPVKIRQLTVKNFDRTLPIRFAKNTGVMVEKIIKK